MKVLTLVVVLGSATLLVPAGCGGGSNTTGGAGATGSAGTGAAGATGVAGTTGTSGTTGTAGTSAAGTTGAAGTGAAGTGAAGTGAAGTTGGAGTGAPDGGTPDGGGSTTMSFFVTSKGPGMGGNLGGLTGADAFCKQLATAVSAALGAKTWHAYLSTSTVNARTRIGEGPWRNAKGVIIANNLADLHSQAMDTGALNATWPVGSTSIALDETGAEVPSNPTTHDVLTGSDMAGMAVPNSNCSDWTSSATTVVATVGHSNRTGGGRPPSWNSAHESMGCGDITGPKNQSVGSGGGRGSIYCFAVP